jgi:thiol-disulfide isomerase/thioredoxin
MFCTYTRTGHHRKWTPLSCILVLCLFLGSNSIAATDAAHDLSGEITRDDILMRSDFAQNYAQYKPTESQLSAMQSLKNKQIYVMFGSWCHDSQREVPRFMKLLDSSGVQVQKVSFIAVDRDKNDKTGISGELKLRYTPTFVVFDGDREVARIIEKPQGDIASDFLRQIKTIE